MTTIVVRNGVIAADTIIWSGGRRYGTCSKLARSKDGWWAGGSGSLSTIAAFHKWFTAHSVQTIKGPWKGLPVPWADDTSILILSPQGETFFYEGHTLVAFKAEYAAEGSGSDYALGAMAMGASALLAVRIAAQFDYSTGGNIEVAYAGARSPTSHSPEQRVAHENNKQVQPPATAGRSGEEGPILQGRSPLLSNGTDRLPESEHPETAT